MNTAKHSPRTEASQSKVFRRVLFQLQKDDDGYPPNEWETLWVKDIENNLYLVDSIPFFIYGISVNDIISAEMIDGELHFRELVSTSGHSTIRVFVNSEQDVTVIRNLLRELNCDSELSHIKRLFSCNIPPSVSLNEVRQLLTHDENPGKWEYEEATIRHTS
jgi:hypothetical protein